ncbi:hypothetical protein ACVWYK_001532 [Bradyrhizobium sp. USDA 4470]
MPDAATASRLAIQASIDIVAFPPSRLTSSGIGIDSTTDQVSCERPGWPFSMKFLRSSTAFRVQASPIGT